MAKAYAPLSVLFEQRRPSADEDARSAFCAWTTGRHHRGAPMSSARLASSRKSVERVIGSSSEGLAATFLWSPFLDCGTLWRRAMSAAIAVVLKDS